jgi:hypothetical protein
VNYQDNATRKTGAISYLMFTSFGMSSNNTVERAKFVNAKPVYFPPMEYKWSNDDYGSGSYRTSVFHDKDGSVGGVPDSFIVINGGIMLDEACEVKPTWNAAVCKGDVGRMTVSAGGGGRGGRPAVLPAAVVAVLPAVVALLPAPLLPQVQLLSRLFREAQLLRPPLVAAVLPAAVAALLLVQGRVASEILRRRSPFSAATARISPSAVPPTSERALSGRSPPNGRPCPWACRN